MCDGVCACVICPMRLYFQRPEEAEKSFALVLVAGVCSRGEEPHRERDVVIAKWLNIEVDLSFGEE